MSPVTIAHFSATGLESASLAKALTSFRERGGELDLKVRTSIQLMDPEGIKEFVLLALNSDALVITLHGGPESFPGKADLEEALEGSINPAVIHVQADAAEIEAMEWSRKLSRGLAPKEIDLARRYLALGGTQNYAGFLALISAAAKRSEEIGRLKAGGQESGRLEDSKPADSVNAEEGSSGAIRSSAQEHFYPDLDGISLPPPQTPLFQGLYHPDRPNLIEEDYLAEVASSGKPVAGLWFYQAWWLNGALGHMDELIRALEERGAAVIAVFHTRYRDIELQNPGADSAAERFFLFPDGSSRIDVLVSPMSFSMTASYPDYRSIYPRIGVPVIQAICSFSTIEDWKGGSRGLSPMDVALSAAQPEMDGNIITVPFAFKAKSEIDPLTGAMGVRYEPGIERTGKVSDLIINWALLRRIPNPEKRIAIIFHHYPPRNDRIGCAAGLDSFQSVADLLKALKDEGYYAPRNFETGDELAQELIGRPTPDKNWLASAMMRERAEAKAGPDLYLPWTEDIPPAIREKMAHDWGRPPGELLVEDGELLFSGFANGNVFITIQPSRGTIESVEKGYHDPYLTPPHQYLAHYRWLRDVWGARAVIHVGKHGSLEWLPGKSLGLSNECFPDLAISDLPNIYPYIVNDPGEGTQAKRRSYAVIIDHMLPDLTTGGLYDETEIIAGLLAERSLALQEDPGKAPILADKIWEAVAAASLDRDMSITEEEAKADFEDFSDRLHSYLGTLNGTMINDGLHILGKSPEGPRLTETIVQLTRINAPGVPALREAAAGLLGYTLDDLEPKRSFSEEGQPRRKPDSDLGSWPAERVRQLSLKLVEAFRERDFDFELAEPVLREMAQKAMAEAMNGPKNDAGNSGGNGSDAAAQEAFKPEDAPKAQAPKPGDGALHYKVQNALDRLKWISSFLAPNLKKCDQEIINTIGALSGGFVPPGPSGAPSRGQSEVLPTGRAFYSVDPRKIPSPAAWKVGQLLADALLARHLKETGRYPANVGTLVYATSTMRTRGDDVAEILCLWGLRPVWKAGGLVDGLEVISLSELGRPRIDVTARISGLFRDAFPNLVEMLDSGASMVAALNEPAEKNFLRGHVLDDIAILKAQGLGEEQAEREATFRVFGCPPGTYGAGVAELVEAGRWKTAEDLGESYIRFSGHAYGQGDAWGLVRPDGFRRNLARMDATIKNEDSREYDMLSCTDYYNYYGGLIAAAKTVRGTPTLSMMGDASDPERVKISTTQEEARRVLRVRLVNPKWIAGLKRHGFKGAGEISHMMDVIFGWDATADVVEDWMWEAAAKSWVFDPETSAWIGKVNPFARRNMLNKLLEAISRGMWNASEEMERKLKDEFLELEGKIEELGDAPPLPKEASQSVRTKPDLASFGLARTNAAKTSISISSAAKRTIQKASANQAIASQANPISASPSQAGETNAKPIQAEPSGSNGERPRP